MLEAVAPAMPEPQAKVEGDSIPIKRVADFLPEKYCGEDWKPQSSRKFFGLHCLPLDGTVHAVGGQPH